MADRIKNYQQEADQITTLKAIRTDFGVTPSSYTPDATVVTKDRVVTFAQAEEEFVVLSDIEKGVKQQVTEVDIAQKDIANIKALLQGHLYDYQTDSTEAYAKSVPAGAMPYAGLEQIGGKTVVMNQILRELNSTYWASSAGVTNITYNDNSVSFQSTNTGYLTQTPYSSMAVKGGHKYYFSVEAYSTTGHCRVYFVADSGTSINFTETSWTHKSVIFQKTNDGNVGLQLQAQNIEDETYHYRNVMLIDLTLMFGAGNEPSTVEEFEAMFPASYYPYNAGTLLSAGVTEVVSKDANSATLQTYPIPTAIRNLEGYGWSAGDVYNYVDFERKVFVQNVKSKTISDGIWAYNSTYGVFLDNGEQLANYPQLICPLYPYGGSYSSAPDQSLCWIFTNRIAIKDSTLNGDVTALMNKINGVTAYCQAKTPIETDISQYITDDNLISVESGGTLTFENQHGTDYQIPVPSEETYMIDLQSAIGG